MALDPNLSVLLTVPVQWEAYEGQDAYGGASYAAAKTLYCRLEPVSLVGGDETVKRTADGTEVLPTARCYFDAADPDVQTFTPYDRFEAATVAAGAKTQPCALDTIIGPDGTSWLVAVTL